MPVEMRQMVHSPHRSPAAPNSGIKTAALMLIAWLSIDRIVARNGLFDTSLSELT